jgi:dipeptidyl aminopeptidase/acylaminoacyl peptidase
MGIGGAAGQTGGGSMMGAGGSAGVPVSPVGTTVDAGAPKCSGLPQEVAQGWIAFDSDRAGYNRDIYMVRGDGSEEKLLVASPGIDKDPAFSPSGKQLAYASDRSGTMQIHVLSFPSGDDVVITSRPDGADQPSWSRDALFIVFHSGASVYRIDMDGKNERLIATGINDLNAYQHPSVSKDGTQVVFDRFNLIGSAPIAGGQVRFVVTDGTTVIETPAVSEDGATVAFAELCDTVEQIALVPFAASTAPCSGTVVSPKSGGTARRPAWGPSKYLAYERGGGQNDPGPTRIAITAGAGSAPCDVVSDAHTSRNPSFGPSVVGPWATAAQSRAIAEMAARSQPTADAATDSQPTADATADSRPIVDPNGCYPHAYGAFYCQPGLSCHYHPVTGCLCADNTISPCKPLDPNCTGPTDSDAYYLGKNDAGTNASCYCDALGYWWCG